MTSDLSQCSACEIAALVAGGQASAREVVIAFRDRVEAFNPALNAVTTLNPRLLEDAGRRDDRRRRGDPSGPLEGVPFVVKDTIPTKDLRTTFGSLIFEHHIPAENAVVVERLLDAGAILLGKANTPEFATDINTSNKIFGLTRNPVDLNVSAGGSSGGTAAAIASDMSPIGIGTDLGGSIRIPAAWCGISGIRLSPGRVPIYPTDFGWDTLVEHVQGPMGRTVADLGLMLSVLAGPDDRDPSSLPDQGHDYARAAREPLDLQGGRIAYSADLGGLFPVDTEVGEKTRAAAARFEEMGCVVEEDCFDTSSVREIIAGTRGFGLVARFSDLVEQHGSLMTSQLTGQVSDALKQDLRSVGRAEKLRTQYWHRVRLFLEKYELLLTPTVAAPPFRIDRPLPTQVGGRPIGRYYDVFLATYAFSLLGLPVASVPCGHTKDGLPIGIQIVGRRLREDKVLGAAAAYATVCPQHFARRPILIDEAVPFSGEFVTPGMRTM